MIRILLFIFIIALQLFSNQITLDWLKSKPKGVVKDFYIWRYLGQPDINATSAVEAYKDVNNKNKPLQEVFKKYESAVKLLPKIESNITDKNITMFPILRIVNDENLTKKQFISSLVTIITDLNQTKKQKELLDMNLTDLNHKNNFYMFLNALRFQNFDVAKRYLDKAYKTASTKNEKDKSLFWDYYIFDNNTSLDSLSTSVDINMYSLFAMEKKGVQPSNIVYKLDVNATDNNVSLNLKDPFFCARCIAKNMKTNRAEFDYYKKVFLKSEETHPHLALLLATENEFKKAYFITPYRNSISKYSPQRQALIYAIGRQESLFLPNLVSSSFALGMMQVMPFVGKAMAKNIGDTYDMDGQFDASTNIRHANEVINLLDKSFNNILFIAYAYNGGGGFLSRTLKKSYFKESKYEPFLSMEMLPNEETREYGKRVLANYLIYHNLLNDKKITLSELLQSIKN